MESFEFIEFDEKEMKLVGKLLNPPKVLKGIPNRFTFTLESIDSSALFGSDYDLFASKEEMCFYLRTKCYASIDNVHSRIKDLRQQIKGCERERSRYIRILKYLSA